MSVLSEYRKIMIKYPLARRIKYLAGDDISKDQMVTLFKEGKVKCTAHFAYPYAKALEREGIRSMLGGMKIFDMEIWTTKDRTDLILDSYHCMRLREMLPMRKDPEYGSWRCFIPIILFFGLFFFLALGCCK